MLPKFKPLFQFAQYHHPRSAFFKDFVSQNDLVESKRFEAYKQRRAKEQDYFYLGLDATLNGFNLIKFMFERELARKIDDAEATEQNGIKLYCLLNPRRVLSGHPGVVHGGCISGIFDEAVGNLSEIASSLQTTATKLLNLTLHKPVFVDKEYMIMAEVQKIEGRKVFIYAKMIDEQENLCSEVNSLNIRNVQWAENLWFGKEEGKHKNLYLLTSMEKTIYALIGDIGGTNSRLQYVVVGESASQPDIKKENTYDSLNHSSLYEIIEQFLSDVKKEEMPKIASIGLAGPVEDGKVDLTNLKEKKGWPQITEQRLKEMFGFETVILMNDLEAAGYGVLELDPKYLHCINEGTCVQRKNKMKTVIGPGTGLGYSFLIPVPVKDGVKYRPFPSEGGNADFAPQSDEQIEFMKFVKKEKDLKAVCLEQCIAGEGYQNLYKFIKSKNQDYPSEIEKDHAHPKSRQIMEYGIKGTDMNCVKFVNFLAEMLAMDASNHALRSLAYSGVYFVGNIMNSLKEFIEKDKENNFMKYYLNKQSDSMVRTLKEIPLYIVTYLDPALMGAFFRVRSFLRGEL